MTQQPFRIGTRGSPLALVQANWVRARLLEVRPGWEVELRIIKTKGDRIQDVPLARVGGKGLFVKEIEEALLANQVDLAVHSLKDMPGDLPAGLKIGAVPLREDPRDAFLSAAGTPLQEVPPGGKIGTSSLRRQAQLLSWRPDLEIVPLRGNLDTRIRKISELSLSGVILAAAGLKRLSMPHLISQYLEPEICLPAVGQGALALEMRDPDPETEKWIGTLHDETTYRCTQAERAFLRTLEGGCQVPLAGHARLTDDHRLRLWGLIASLDGRTLLRGELTGTAGDPEGLGTALAEQLLAKGGRKILEEAYGTQGIGHGLPLRQGPEASS